MTTLAADVACLMLYLLAIFVNKDSIDCLQRLQRFDQLFTKLS